MLPRDRILTSLGLLLLLVLSLSCNPNPQPEALTPIPTLAPGATLTLVTEISEPVTAVGQEVPSPAPAAGDPASGGVVFANCVPCHGEDATGAAIGPTLIGAEIKAKPDDYYRQTIADGVSGTAMPPWSGRLSAQEVEDVIAFLRSKQ